MLISEEYREQQRKLHENPNYGVMSVKYAPLVSNVINKLHITELLDYGAGKGRLAQNLKVDHKMRIQMYEPANPDWAFPPSPSQMVTCIDVLEHIEPDNLDDVLDDLKRVTNEVGFFTIHTGPAMKVLDDGRNAHLIQQDADWWLPKILARWQLNTFQRTENGFWVMVEPR